MEITTILTMYFAFVLVMILHELGHLPEKIGIRWFGPIPIGVAMRSYSRSGGLIVNVAIAVLVFYFKPENLLLQFMGLIAWAHFIVYAILGSVIPEPKESQVNIKTYVFDDVPNDQAIFYIGAATLLFIFLQGYYIALFAQVLA